MKQGEWHGRQNLDSEAQSLLLFVLAGEATADGISSCQASARRCRLHGPSVPAIDSNKTLQDASCVISFFHFDRILDDIDLFRIEVSVSSSLTFENRLAGQEPRQGLKALDVEEKQVCQIK